MQFKLTRTGVEQQHKHLELESENEQKKQSKNPKPKPQPPHSKTEKKNQDQSKKIVGYTLRFKVASFAEIHQSFKIFVCGRLWLPLTTASSFRSCGGWKPLGMPSFTEKGKRGRCRNLHPSCLASNINK